MQRRKFIQKSTLASTSLLSTVYLPNLLQSQNIKVGLIGAGWYGMVITEAALEVGGIEVMAVCDVDEKHLAESIEKLTTIQDSKPKGFADYREMMEEDLDAIFIGTPPHWHALQFVAACEKGLDIYCEKPLAYDIEEGQAMVAAAKDADNFVQIGFQRRKAPSFQKVKEMINTGKLGAVHEVSAHIHYNPNILDTTPQDPPSTLDWETWCGPAPKLEYRPSIGHKTWRLERAYGNGHLVDWGIHHIDAIRMMMDLDMPHEIGAEGGMNALHGKITTPDTLHATMTFDKIPLKWDHRLWGTGTRDGKHKNGVSIYGEKASVFVSDRQLVVLQNSKDAAPEEHEVSAQTIRQDMMRDFIQAVQQQDKSKISGPVDDAAKSTACVQLAMIAHYTDSTIHWDQQSGKIKDNTKANKLLARPYRDGYTRP